MIGKLNSRKGQSHVEIIISFIIFIGFLGFIIFMFNPFQRVVDPTMVDTVFNKVNLHISDSFRSVSINLNNEPFDCFSIQNISGMNCKNPQMFVKNREGEAVRSRISGSNYELEPKGTYYTIYCSDYPDSLSVSQLGGPPGSCTTLGSDKYEIGIVVNNRYWVEDKVLKFNESYFENYREFKQDFISGGSDFGMTYMELDDTIIFNAMINVPTRVDVYSKLYPISVFNKSADVERKKVIISFW